MLEGGQQVLETAVGGLRCRRWSTRARPMVSAKGKLGFALTEKVETGKPLLLLTHAKTLFEDFAWEAVIEMPSSVQRQYREKLVTYDSSVLCIAFAAQHACMLAHSICVFGVQGPPPC